MLRAMLAAIFILMVLYAIYGGPNGGEANCGSQHFPSIHNFAYWQCMAQLAPMG